MRLRLLVACLATATALMAAPPTAVGCSGTALIGDSETDAPNARAIFSGTAVRVEDPRSSTDMVWSSMDGMRWTFVVDDVERGFVGDRMTVQTARSSASCGVEFQLGTRYRVVAIDGALGLWAWTNPGTRELPALPSPPPVEGSALAVHPFPWILLVLAGAIVAGTVAFIRMGRPRTA